MPAHRKMEEDDTMELFCPESDDFALDPFCPDSLSDDPEAEEWTPDLLYLEAHRWLPFGWSFRGAPHQMELVRQAAEFLDGSCDDDDKLLWAIAILGHSPCSLAFVALGRYAAGSRWYASVANQALAECLQAAESDPFASPLESCFCH
jgi:hypothetical protein